jgi:outer membrane protein assembly factor BamB
MKARLLPVLLALAVQAGAGDATSVAEVLRQVGPQRGLAVDSSHGDAAFAIALARQSSQYVCRVTERAETVSAERAAAAAAGLDGLRLRIEAGPLEAAGYPDYAADLVIGSGLPDAARLQECARICRPDGLLVLLPTAGALTPEQAKSHLAAHAAGLWNEPRACGAGVSVRRAKLDGAAEWTHYFREPNNNRYSPDKFVRAPLRILWYGAPQDPVGDLLSTHALSAGGRIFLADASPADTTRARLTCLNAFNGFRLWEREAGGSRYTRITGTAREGALAIFQLPGCIHPGEMAVSAERVYVADSRVCLVLDAASGQELARIPAPPPTHPENCWRFVAYQDGLLFGYADAPVPMPGPRPGAPTAAVPAGGPPTLFALDLATGAPRWVRGGAGDTLGGSFGTPLAIGEGRIFVRANTNQLQALETRTGKTAWQVELPEAPASNTWWEGTVHAGKFMLCQFDRRTWSFGGKNKLVTLTFRVQDGSRLNEQACDTAAGAARDLFFDAKEGFLGPPPRPRLGCNYGSAAGNIYFHRNGYYLENPKLSIDDRMNPLHPYGGVRAACGVGVLPANGLAHVLPNGLACGCGAFHATLTLEPGPPVETFAPGPLPAAEAVSALPAAEAVPAGAADWPTSMADAQRSGITRQNLSRPLVPAWDVRLPGELTPCVAAGALVFLGSSDETIRALDAATGKVRWTFAAAGPVKNAPAYWNGRIFTGCEDGWLYCLAAADGRLLWKLRGGPSARRQVAFERVISAWPLRHGVAVEDGTVYFSAGFLPGNRQFGYAADAQSGQVRWRTQIAAEIIPCGDLVLKPDTVMYPSPGSAAIYHPVFLSRKDGSRQGGGNTHNDFTQCRFVPGEGIDDPEYRKGFLVYGGSPGFQRGYREGVGYSGRPQRYANNYALLPEPPDTPGTKPSVHGQVADGASFLPLFTAAEVFLRAQGAVVCVARTNILKLADTRILKGGEREPFYRWKAPNLPCGEPQWLLAATGAKDGDAATLLAGGPKGVVAIAAADGKVLWSVPWEGVSLPAAIANGRVFATFADGRVCALEAKK